MYFKCKYDFTSRYFGDCPVLNIPGFIHPVESHFLEDLPKDVSLRLNKAWNSSNVNGTLRMK